MLLPSFNLANLMRKDERNAILTDMEVKWNKMFFKSRRSIRLTPMVFK